MERKYDSLMDFWINLFRNTDHAHTVAKHYLLTPHMKLLESVMGMYNSSGRHYHNLEHVDSVLKALSEFHGEIESEFEWECLVLAAIFHDAVYVPGAGNNEEKSADLWYSYSLPWGERYSNEVYYLIGVTKDHLPTTPIGSIMSDIDMRGLGGSFDTFMYNLWNLMHEFTTFVSPTDFMIGQCKFLRLRAERPRIFHTEKFYDRYEKKARKNINDFFTICRKDWGMTGMSFARPLDEKG